MKKPEPELFGGAPMWRVGGKVKINVYEGDRPVCQCHSKSDARRIVEAMNRERQRWLIGTTVKPSRDVQHEDEFRAT